MCWHPGGLAGLPIIVRPSTCICRWMTLHLLPCICNSVGLSLVHSCLALSTCVSSMSLCCLHWWAQIDLRWSGVSNSCLGLCLPSSLCISGTILCIPWCLTLVVLCILLLVRVYCVLLLTSIGVLLVVLVCQ